MDFNPKTNLAARATYEVLGYGAAFVATISLFVWLLEDHPKVVLGVVFVAILAFIAWMLISWRLAVLEDNLEYEMRTHNGYHTKEAPEWTEGYDYASEYGPQADCKYCHPEGVQVS